MYVTITMMDMNTFKQLTKRYKVYILKAQCIDYHSDRYEKSAVISR